ncbi:MAG: hypothetical protein FD129_3343 [bacterium]|nr:MAG: hypothetical protein FD129_3343 [bacterium]
MPRHANTLIAALALGMTHYNPLAKHLILEDSRRDYARHVVASAPLN